MMTKEALPLKVRRGLTRDRRNRPLVPILDTGPRHRNIRVLTPSAPTDLLS